MKKLYRKGTVYPSPPVISDHLSFLPATILTLTAALSPEDREVLAYLISCSDHTNLISNHLHRKTSHHQKTKNSSSIGNMDHPPMFACDCFWCYMSYWVRWDSSPNRHLIHEIIDAFEDWLLMQGKSNNKSRKDRKRKGNNVGSGDQLKRPELSLKDELREREDSEEENSCERGDGSGGEEEGPEKGSVRRFVSFIGERIWGVLGQSII